MSETTRCSVKDCEQEATMTRSAARPGVAEFEIRLCADHAAAIDGGAKPELDLHY